jgi:hypothetical protein
MDSKKLIPNPTSFSCRRMIVKTLQGIPFLVDSATKQIYAYEKPLVGTPLCLGTYDPVKETFQLAENWKELYAPKLAAYHDVEKPRSRLPTATR